MLSRIRKHQGLRHAESESVCVVVTLGRIKLGRCPLPRAPHEWITSSEYRGRMLDSGTRSSTTRAAIDQAAVAGDDAAVATDRRGCVSCTRTVEVGMDPYRERGHVIDPLSAAQSLPASQRSNGSFMHCGYCSLWTGVDGTTPSGDLECLVQIENRETHPEHECGRQGFHRLVANL